jgi:hypothetical protein
VNVQEFGIGIWHRNLAPVVGIEPTLTRFWRPPLYR